MRAQRLSEARIAEMFAAYQEKPTVNHVVEKCRVSASTVQRWRDRGHWDKRIAEIQAAVNKKADETTAEMLARHAKHARVIQAVALNRILGPTRKGAFDTTADARLAYFEATKEERIARGEAGERTEVILDEVRRRYAGRSEEKTR